MAPLSSLLHPVQQALRELCAQAESCADATDRRAVLLALQSMIDELHVAQSKVIAVATAQLDWIGCGHRNMADWLASTTKSSPSDAKRKAQLGAALTASPELDHAVSSGALSPDAATSVADAIINPPARATADDVAELVQSVAGATPSEARQAADRWRQIVSSESEEEAEAHRFAARSVTLSPPTDGMSTLTVQGPVLQMRSLFNAINHAAGAPVEGDGRTNVQRLADGAFELARLYNSQQVKGGRENPNILIVIPVDGFTGATDEAGVTAWGDRIPAHVVRELAKNATLQRVVMAGSKVLDLGRKVRFATDDQYTALVARDGRCRFGGCTIPAAWCEADHMVEWQHGGTSDLESEWLLCSFHHHLRHTPGATIIGSGASARLRLPDGTVIPCPPNGAGARPVRPGEVRRRSAAAR